MLILQPLVAINRFYTKNTVRQLSNFKGPIKKALCVKRLEYKPDRAAPDPAVIFF